MKKLFFGLTVFTAIFTTGLVTSCSNDSVETLSTTSNESNKTNVFGSITSRNGNNKGNVYNVAVANENYEITETFTTSPDLVTGYEVKKNGNLVYKLDLKRETEEIISTDYILNEIETFKNVQNFNLSKKLKSNNGNHNGWDNLDESKFWGLECHEIPYTTQTQCCRYRFWIAFCDEPF